MVVYLPPDDAGRDGEGKTPHPTASQTPKHLRTDSPPPSLSLSLSLSGDADRERESSKVGEDDNTMEEVFRQRQAHEKSQQRNPQLRERHSLETRHGDRGSEGGGSLSGGVWGTGYGSMGYGVWSM